jgi:hypothetical protein
MSLITLKQVHGLSDELPISRWNEPTFEVVSSASVRQKSDRAGETVHVSETSSEGDYIISLPDLCKFRVLETPIQSKRRDCFGTGTLRSHVGQSIQQPLLWLLPASPGELHQ